MKMSVIFTYLVHEFVETMMHDLIQCMLLQDYYIVFMKDQASTERLELEMTHLNVLSSLKGRFVSVSQSS